MEKKQDSYAVLGVSLGASREEIEKRYAELQQLFSSQTIPGDLADWAAEQRERLRRAYQELTGEGPAPEAGEPEEEGAEPHRPSIFQRLLDRPLLMGGIGVVVGILILAGFFGVRAWTGKGSASTPPATQQGTGVDAAKVKELEAKVKQNPKDEESMLALGDLYFVAEKWDDAARWYGRVLDVNPKHVTATIDMGTAQFYLGRSDMAKMLWTRATELDPNNAEAHFNLGILYSVIEPVDPEATQREWQKVLELAPDSRLADIVRQHQQISPTPEATPAAPQSTPTP